MKITIGSTNPVKVNAVKQVLKPLYPKASYVSVNTDSQVGDQPMSIKATKTGAKNRAQSALKTTQADMAVGLEGGIFEIDDRMYSFAWCAVTDKTGKTSFGGGMCFPLPPKIAKAIDQGGELGPLMDKLTGKKDIKKKGGSISILTNGLTTRIKGYKELIRMALTEFRRPDLY